MIYEYKCTKCKKIIEKFQTVTTELEILCPLCETLMRRIISKSNFKLVGSGFYVNDYPKEGNKSDDI